MFVDVALKAVLIQFIYAAAVIGISTLVTKISESRKKKEGREE